MYHLVLERCFSPLCSDALLSLPFLYSLCYLLFIFFYNYVISLMLQNLFPFRILSLDQWAIVFIPVLTCDSFNNTVMWLWSFYFLTKLFPLSILILHLSSFSCIQVPVVDGYSYPHLTKRMNVAGRHITSYLVDLLSRRG